MATPSKTTKIGKYDVIETIGRGGMGVVYQAKDPYLDRLVAIKMMNVDVHENPDFLERFYREAKSTASLVHPNIVTVYELGEHEGRPFMVMQYLEGHSLEALLRAHRPMTLLEKISIIIEVCQGLAFAHQHGIIHRDIKPGNIMVLNDGGVKIVDFGIARLGDTTLTRTGQIVGSLYYMPPEQLRDKPVDTRADIYSTGVVLYQLLTYSLPFEGESTGATLTKIISDDPPPFSQFALSYPPELEAITLKALAKNRDLRFATAEAFAGALAEVQDRLKQDSIKQYLTKAELLQQSNELQQAQDYLLKVLKLDRHHTMAAKQLSAVRAKLQAQLSAERVRQLKQQAEEACGRDEFDAALAFMNQAIELDNNPELQALRTNIEKTKAEAELVRKAIARAEAAQRSGDLDSAKSAIESAFSRRPNDSKIKVLRRAIERDLEERERQRHVEGLLDEARKQMAGRKFTAALDLLREAQKLDPGAPQLRILLERLASEHQQEKQRRELERINREVQEAIDRDDYKAASAKAAEALGKFPSETGLARLKELADAQIEIAAQKEFVRNQTAAAQQLLDSGQTQHALDAVEKALQKVPGNARLESFRAMINDRMTIERTEADKATCLRQANEAISLGRYPDAIQILESAQVRFVDSTELDELLRFALDQQAKVRRQAFVEEAMRAAQRLLAEQDFEGAVKLLEKAVDQVPSEDLDLLLQQAREQRDSFRHELQAAIAKGKSLLEAGAIANAREFLSSRPVSYQQSAEFRDLIEEAQSTAIPALHVDGAGTEATQMFSRVGPRSDASTVIEPAPPPSIFPPVEPEPVPEEPSELPETKPPSPWKRKPLVIGAFAAALVVVGLVIWWLLPAKPKEAYLNVQSNSGAHVVIDEKASGVVGTDGTLRVTITPGSHRVQVSLDGYEPKIIEGVTVKAGETLPLPAELVVVASAPPPPTVTPQPPAPVGNLVVRTNIDRAEIFVDGKLKGLTGRDKKFETPLNEGKYRIQARKAGYDDSPEQRIEITAKKKEQQVTLTLNKAAGPASPPPTDAYLNIQSKPGASVRVDGVQEEPVGSDGTRLVKVSPGDHRVEVNLQNFEPWSGASSVKAGDQLSVRATLTPVPPPVVVKPPPPPTPAATISSFKASPDTIQAGGQTTLAWETQNATSVSISPGIGKVEARGEMPLKPTRTIDYTLTATGPGGSADPRSVTITVTAKVELPTAPSTPKESVSSAPSAAPPDVAGVREALNTFKDIFEGMVAEDLRSVWPSITKKQIDAIKNANKGAQSLRLTENCAGSPKITGDAAEWTCSETMTYVIGGKRQEPRTSTIFFSFEKTGGKWYIHGRHG